MANMSAIRNQERREQNQSAETGTSKGPDAPPEEQRREIAEAANKAPASRQDVHYESRGTTRVAVPNERDTKPTAQKTPKERDEFNKERTDRIKNSEENGHWESRGKTRVWVPEKPELQEKEEQPQTVKVTQLPAPKSDPTSKEPSAAKPKGPEEEQPAKPTEKPVEKTEKKPEAESSAAPQANPEAAKSAATQQAPAPAPAASTPQAGEPARYVVADTTVPGASISQNGIHVAAPAAQVATPVGDINLTPTGVGVHAHTPTLPGILNNINVAGRVHTGNGIVSFNSHNLVGTAVGAVKQVVGLLQRDKGVTIQGVEFKGLTPDIQPEPAPGGGLQLRMGSATIALEPGTAKVEISKHGGYTTISSLDHPNNGLVSGDVVTLGPTGELHRHTSIHGIPADQKVSFKTEADGSVMLKLGMLGKSVSLAPGNMTAHVQMEGRKPVVNQVPAQSAA